MSKPSRAYNLTYLAFGYTFASLFVTGFYEFSFQDRILLAAPIGGFIGAFLFYLKPELILIKIILRLRGIHAMLESPYLVETKGYVIGALYFSLSILVAIFTLSLPLELRIILIVAAIVTSTKFLMETARLGRRAILTSTYYRLVGQETSVDLRELRSTLPSIRSALEKGDWMEADQLIRQLIRRGS